jgi:dipeptidyl aminopeptidase/acylaminoacyl peptidase
MDGGEARQVTRLPRDVSDVTWSPDGRSLCVVSASLTEAPLPHIAPEETPQPDIRQIDRLMYELNGAGFTYDRPGRLWRIDLETGAARRLTSGLADDGQPRWSPDGTRIAFVSARHRDADLTWRQDVYLVGAEGGRVERLTAGRGEQIFDAPAWSPDGAWIAAVGHRNPAKAGSRGDVWRFRATAGQAGENLTEEADLFADAAMNSDLLGAGGSAIHWSGDGAGSRSQRPSTAATSSGASRPRAAGSSG